MNIGIERRASRSVFGLIQYTEPSEHLCQLKKATSDSCYLIVILTVTPLECNSFDAYIVAVPYSYLLIKLLIRNLRTPESLIRL